MSKYLSARSAVITKLKGNPLGALEIIPTGINVSSDAQEFLRWTLITSPDRFSLVNLKGQLIIEIFTPAKLGSKRVHEIADALDNLFVNSSVEDLDGSTHFLDSALGVPRKDSDNSHLSVSEYVLNFKFRRL